MLLPVRPHSQSVFRAMCARVSGAVYFSPCFYIVLDVYRISHAYNVFFIFLHLICIVNQRVGIVNTIGTYLITRQNTG